MSYSNIAISYGTYYSYLNDKESFNAQFNIEATVQKFNDGEIAVEFPQSIRGRHMFIFGDSVFNFMELIMTIDAAWRASASEITIVMPYYGYARQDKRGNGRASIGAATLANIFSSMKVSRIISIDLHADQIQGYFNGPFEHLSGRHLFAKIIADKRKLLGPDKLDIIRLCSPDAGGTVRVSKFANALNIPMVGINKRRDKPGSIESMQLYGDVKGMHVFLIDDMVDTGGTLIKAVKYLYEEGAIAVEVIITHPVLSNNATEKLEAAGIKLITANTRNTVRIGKHKNIETVDCTHILWKAIWNVVNNGSVLTTLS